MSFKIEHENPDKSMSIGTVNTPIEDIKFKSRQFDQFKHREPSDEEGETLGLNFLANQDKKVDKSSDSFSEQSRGEYPPSQSEGGGYMDNAYMREDMGGDDNYQEQGLSYEEIQHQKAFYLSQLKRLEKKGHFCSRRLGTEHSLSEIKGEVLKIKKEIEIDRGINYCKKGLMFFVTTIEMLNNRYDPFDIELDGWSNVMMADQDNYDDVFEELYEKYNTKVSMSPEIKLISMVAGSAMMFHLQKSLVNKHLSGNGGGLLGSLGNFANNFTQREKSPEPQKMKGPSVDTDELLRKLNTDDFSDISSNTSADQGPSAVEISVPVQKKKGRPRKKQD